MRLLCNKVLYIRVQTCIQCTSSIADSHKTIYYIIHPGVAISEMTDWAKFNQYTIMRNPADHHAFPVFGP